MNDPQASNKEILKNFLISALVCAIIGICTGFFGAIFHYLLDLAANIRASLPWLIWFLPIGGLLIALVFKRAHIGEYFNTEKFHHAVEKSEKVSFWLAPVIYFSSFLTHLFGGSAGREGAAVAIGGSIGSDFSRVFKRDSEKRFLYTIAGMSGAFSGILVTPFASVIFSLETTILYKKRCIKDKLLALVCASVSSLFGFLTGLLLQIKPLSFEKISFEGLDVKSILLCLLLIVCAMAVAIIFKLLLKLTKKAYRKINNFYIRIFVGGSIVLILTLLIGSQRYNGTGFELIFDAMASQAEVYDFILKMLFTILTMACGYCGGEMIPSMVIGASFGFAFASLFPISLEIAVCISLICVFATFMRSPIAAFVLAIELFGISGFLYYTIVLIPVLAYVILIQKYNKKIEA
ncbi:MAG: chloride channel protein [Clostridia bacterium]|nr:chloride channel protein [Clostridia bacterium]